MQLKFRRPKHFVLNEAGVAAQTTKCQTAP